MIKLWLSYDIPFEREFGYFIKYSYEDNRAETDKRRSTDSTISIFPNSDYSSYDEDDDSSSYDDRYENEDDEDKDDDSSTWDDEPIPIIYSTESSRSTTPSASSEDDESDGSE